MKVTFSKSSIWPDGATISYRLDRNSAYKDALQWINVQSSGRCEVLDCNDGLQDIGDGEVEIIFQSSAIINDDRMISSRRRLCFDVDGTYLKYEQDMSTTSHDVLTNHLVAELTKKE